MSYKSTISNLTQFELSALQRFLKWNALGVTVYSYYSHQYYKDYVKKLKIVFKC